MTLLDHGCGTIHRQSRVLVQKAVIEFLVVVDTVISDLSVLIRLVRLSNHLPITHSPLLYLISSSQNRASLAPAKTILHNAVHLVENALVERVQFERLSRLHLSEFVPVLHSRFLPGTFPVNHRIDTSIIVGSIAGSEVRTQTLHCVQCRLTTIQTLHLGSHRRIRLQDVIENACQTYT